MHIGSTIQYGQVRSSLGMYLICDNGYLRWPTTICPFTRINKSTPEGYFSTNIESVCKDVECTFGILKKRWKILYNGFQYRDIGTCKEIFVTCCCLHNYLLDMMESSNVRVGRGWSLENDGIWLSEQHNHTIEENNDKTDRLLSTLFPQRRNLLVHHLYLFCKKGGKLE